MNERAAAVLAYHERSKHRLDRYAPGPDGLDWANQPDPFRRFAGAPRLALPHAADALATRYGDLRCGVPGPASARDLAHVATLFELSLGLSAWKSFGGNRWALRCNPSSGNLHPTEGYLVCPALDGIPAGVHHYMSRDHALEQRAAILGADWERAFGGAGVIVGLASIPWREAWKYGLRAWRYCQHDCGHAIGAVSYAAAALGWHARVLGAVSDEDCARLLGLGRAADFEEAEDEVPDVLLWIGDPGAMPDAGAMARLAGRARWHGRANRLSASHVAWPDIARVEAAARKPAGAGRVAPALPAPWTADRAALAGERCGWPFAKLARQRRSAVDFDGVTAIPKESFFSMLACLLPAPSAPPWNALPAGPLVHPAIMVHRVEGLEPGLYLLVRNEAALEPLRAAMRGECLWERTGPGALPLYFLFPYDLRGVAKLVCCHQDIAADGCFALGMIAPFDGVERSPWRYPELFRECGMLGQVLYLEAEAAGMRATGIGCYFDDEMHRLLGIAGHAWQSLYHFTVGAPVEDPRLLTLPAYGA